MHDDIIEHVSNDAGYNRGYKEGVKHTQQQMLKLMDQVVNAYRYKELKMESRDANETRDKLVAVEFMRDYVMTGGATDHDGNTVCVPR